MTAGEVVTEAKWLAREHARETDPYAPAQWLACVVAVWPRLWAVHPEAFHVDGVLVGRMPAAPVAVGDEVAIGAEWVGVLAAGVAARALAAVRQADEAAAGVTAAMVARLEARFAAGVG